MFNIFHRKTDEEQELERLEGKDAVHKLQDAIGAAINVTPRMAIIGQAGVGKSSTINVLFGTNQHVSPVLPGTHGVVEIEINTGGGKIIVYDVPGLGEEQRLDSVYLDLYRELLPNVDVTLWVTDFNRNLAPVQGYLAEVRSMLRPEVYDRIIIGINKIDLINVGKWRTAANQPDGKMEEAIHEHAIRVSQILNVDISHVVAYSVVKRYNLEFLFNSLIKALPPEKVLAFDKRAQIADQSELMTTRYQQYMRRAGF